MPSHAHAPNSLRLSVLKLKIFLLFIYETYIRKADGELEIRDNITHFYCPLALYIYIRECVPRARGSMGLYLYSRLVV